jgi:tRNA A-37 threonylcarbamoyl transferase component Bud32
MVDELLNVAKNADHPTLSVNDNLCAPQTGEHTQSHRPLVSSYHRSLTLVARPVACSLRFIGDLVLRICPFAADRRTVELLRRIGKAEHTAIATYTGFRTVLALAVLLVGLEGATQNLVLWILTSLTTCMGWLMPNFFLAGRVIKFERQAPDAFYATYANRCLGPFVRIRRFLALIGLILLFFVVCCTLPQATLALWILFIGIGGVVLFARLGATLTARISHGAIVIGDLEKPYMSLSWQNLVSVRASVEQKFFLFPKREFLWLCFTDHNIPISLKKLKAHEKVKLFNMLSQTVPIEALSPEALYLQIQTLSGNSGATIRDFTEIWLDEFNRRFELSNHVPLAAGTLVGARFTVLATLAVRMNQTVYLIKSKSGEHLVLKELVTAGDDDEALKAKTLEHFEREAAFLARLSHPQIVKIRDHFVEGDRQYMAMDYIDGPNLREYVRANGRFSATQTRKVAGQIAEILEYLHGQAPSVVHRDLTPNNLLYLSKAERIVLVDFGSANTFVTNGTATLVGRQSYMPPEQFKGKPEPASDIYAFAATLHFLLTGEDPKPLEIKEIVGLADGQLNSLISACGLLDPTQRPSAAEIISILNGLSAPMPGISGAKQ